MSLYLQRAERQIKKGKKESVILSSLYKHFRDEDEQLFWKNKTDEYYGLFLKYEIKNIEVLIDYSNDPDYVSYGTFLENMKNRVIEQRKEYESLYPVSIINDNNQKIYIDYSNDPNHITFEQFVDPNDMFIETPNIYNTKVIGYYKTYKIEIINKECKKEIINSFKSDALGEVNTYASDQIDQLNLVGMVSTDEDGYFKANGEYKPHTKSQLKQVLRDGKGFKQALLQRAKLLKEQINQAATVEELRTIKW